MALTSCKAGWGQLQREHSATYRTLLTGSASPERGATSARSAGRIRLTTRNGKKSARRSTSFAMPPICGPRNGQLGQAPATTSGHTTGPRAINRFRARSRPRRSSSDTFQLPGTSAESTLPAPSSDIRMRASRTPTSVPTVTKPLGRTHTSPVEGANWYVFRSGGNEFNRHLVPLLIRPS